MPAKMTSDILSVANMMKTDEERVNYLRQNPSKAVRELLRHNFNKDIKFLLPEGRPDLKEDEFNPRRGFIEGVDDGATLNYEVR